MTIAIRPIINMTTTAIDMYSFDFISFYYTTRTEFLVHRDEKSPYGPFSKKSFTRA
jgi:hypothetical protein